MKNITFSFLVSPSVIIALSSLLSCLAWCFLSEEMYYTLKIPFSFISFGVFLVIIWYLYSSFFAFLGFSLGRKVRFKTSLLDKYTSLNLDITYRFFVYIACLGSFYSIFYIANSLGGWAVLIDLILSSQANQLKHTLYTDYSVGLRSLRYISIHAMSYTVFRFVVLKKSNLILSLLSLLSLLLCSLISSRLSIVVTILETTLLLIIYGKFNISLKRLIILVISFYLLISVFNYTRNYNFYKEHSNMNFFQAGAADILVYLGTPFQGAISVGENYHWIYKDPLNWKDYSGIPTSLTTNSTFLYFFRDIGWFSFIKGAFFLFIYSFIAGIMFNFKNNPLIFVYTTLMYIMAEFWRVPLFFQGIMLALIIVPIFIIFVIIIIRYFQFYLNSY